MFATLPTAPPLGKGRLGGVWFIAFKKQIDITHSIDRFARMDKIIN
jgi:hypothetical protein